MSNTVITMTIEGIPISMNGQMSLVDAVVCVDFAQIAAKMACGAAYTKAKKSTAMDSSIVVKAINQRPLK